LKRVNLKSIPDSFRDLNPDLLIIVDDRVYRKSAFLRLFQKYKPKRVTKNTELINKHMLTTNKISNIPKNKRGYLNINSNVRRNPNRNVKNELIRIYNTNGINEYMHGRREGRLHGHTAFRQENVKKIINTNSVNKNVYLRNIKARLQNSTLNNLRNNVNRIKNNLPSNVSRNDVNNVVRNMKPYILNKIFNKLKNNPPNNRVRIMNTMKNKGFMNNSDINSMKNRLNL
jgi:hypothetical protein